MPNTRKRNQRAVYKYVDDSDPEHIGDFSDSGSEAKISDSDHTTDEDDEGDESSAEEFTEKSNKRMKTHKKPIKKTKFAKSFISKIKPNISAGSDDETTMPSSFSVKNLTHADKLLPTVLNLSESGQ